MRYARSLVFDALETRKLMSAGHHAAAHAKARDVPAGTMVLSGTLTVNNALALSSDDASGDVQTATPVSGRLAGLGAVRGTWYEDTDEYGDYLPPDNIYLRTSEGTIVIAFNSQEPTKESDARHGAVTYDFAQLARGETGTYTNYTESGTIDLTSNSARNAVKTMELQS
jgi:hypothetical protein